MVPRKRGPRTGLTKNEYAQRRYESARVWFDALKNRPCLDCGGKFPTVCMDYDHRPGENKLFKVASGVVGRSTESVLAEIAKCDLVCANCHRIRTFLKRDHKMTLRKAA